MHIDTLTLETMDGLALRGDLAVPDRCIGAAVVCHPHPLYGGDRFNPVVETIFRTCAAAGLATVRFDFRGVNDSEGVHGNGVDERMDVLAALVVAETYAGEGSLLLAGYSFGSLVALDSIHPRVDAWLAVAPPLGMRSSPPASSTDGRPKHLLVAAHDQFCGPETARTALADWTRATMQVVEMADHFFGGRLDEIGSRTAEIVSALGAP